MAPCVPVHVWSTVCNRVCVSVGMGVCVSLGPPCVYVCLPSSTCFLYRQLVVQPCLAQAAYLLAWSPAVLTSTQHTAPTNGPAMVACLLAVLFCVAWCCVSRLLHFNGVVLSLPGCCRAVDGMVSILEWRDYAWHHNNSTCVPCARRICQGTATAQYGTLASSSSANPYTIVVTAGRQTCCWSPGKQTWALLPLCSMYAWS